MSQVADQPYWASRITALGIATGHDGPTPTAGSLSAALEIALAPEPCARAAAVAGTIRIDGAKMAANLLEASTSPTPQYADGGTR